MKIFNFIAFALIIILCNPSFVFSYNVNELNYEEGLQTPYNNDISRFERMYFDRTFENENINNRLSRIEKKLYNSTYETLPTSKRLNQIIAFSKGDDFPLKEGKKLTFKNKLMNMFQGEETGFTPELYDCPYLHQIGPSYNRGFYANSDWANHNIYYPSVGLSFP